MTNEKITGLLDAYKRLHAHVTSHASTAELQEYPKEEHSAVLSLIDHDTIIAADYGDSFYYADDPDYSGEIPFDLAESLEADVGDILQATRSVNLPNVYVLVTEEGAETFDTEQEAEDRAEALGI